MEENSFIWKQLEWISPIKRIRSGKFFWGKPMSYHSTTKWQMLKEPFQKHDIVKANKPVMTTDVFTTDMVRFTKII